MKQLIFAILIVVPSLSIASGLDDVVLWHEMLPDSNSFSLEPFNVARKDFMITLMHAEPYQIGSLHWNYMGFKYGMGKLGFFGNARFYGLNDLYTQQHIVMGIGMAPYKFFAGAISISHQWEKFADQYSYDRYDMNLRFAGAVGHFNAMLDLDRLNLKKPYDFPNINNPEPMFMASYSFYNGFRISAGLKHLYTDRTRWFFDQKVVLIKAVDLNLGYISKPGVITWGLDLYWKSITFNFNYLAMSRLNDTMAMGLSFRI